jgi:pimeloyl-ACP methyl ester carboxylesterase
MSLQARKIMRVTISILKWLGIGLLALLVMGAVYQQVGAALDAGLAPPQSEMVSVDGHKMHLSCMGQGPRTFVLDAGAGAGTFEWWRLQPRLAKAGRACAFDRSGLGWSDSLGGAHDAASSADELAALVKAAGIATPFVYVGHSLGANNGIVYRDKYPHDVSALVLIEPGNPKDLLEDFHGSRADAFRRSDCAWMCRLASVAGYLGIPRLAAQFFVAPGKNLYGRAFSQYRATLGRPSEAAAFVSSYLDALPRTAYEELDVHSLGDTPVLVFASSDPLPGDDEFKSASDYTNWRKQQHAYLASLAAMSAHGEGPVVIPNSNHSSMVMGAPQSAFMARTIVSFVSNGASAR